MLLQEKKKEEKNPDFGEDSEDIDELFSHMGKIPLIKHAVLNFFYEYKLKNNRLIQKLFKEAQRDEPKKRAKR
jgi:hypothetical protein